MLDTLMVSKTSTCRVEIYDVKACEKVNIQRGRGRGKGG